MKNPIRVGWGEPAKFLWAVGFAHCLVLSITLYPRLPTSEALPKELHHVYSMFITTPCATNIPWDTIYGEFAEVLGGMVVVHDPHDDGVSGYHHVRQGGAMFHQGDDTVPRFSSPLKGKRVTLLDLAGEQVGMEIVTSVDQQKVVMGIEIGTAYCEVSFSFANKPNVLLVVEDQHRKKMKDAVGSHILWLIKYVTVDVLRCQILLKEL